jgi:hypothetical protein
MTNHYFTPDVDHVEADEDCTCDRCEVQISEGQPIVEISQKVGFFSGDFMVEHDYEYETVCTSCWREDGY